MSYSFHVSTYNAPMTLDTTRAFKAYDIHEGALQCVSKRWGFVAQLA